MRLRSPSTLSWLVRRENVLSSAISRRPCSRRLPTRWRLMSHQSHPTERTAVGRFTWLGVERQWPRAMYSTYSTTRHCAGAAGVSAAVVVFSASYQGHARKNPAFCSRLGRCHRSLALKGKDAPNGARHVVAPLAKKESCHGSQCTNQRFVTRSRSFRQS